MNMEISDYKDLEYDHFVEVLLKQLIDSCKEDDILLQDLIDHLDSQLASDLRLVLSKIRNEKIDTILNERS